VFKTDISGTVTLEIVRRVGKVLKTANYMARPLALEPFLMLRLEKDVVIHPFATAAQKRELLNRATGEHLSQKKRKLRKAEKLLQKEFREAEATYSMTELTKTHTAILDSVFATYFRVLKRATRSPLLPTVLRGIARHAQ
jgi:nucleolar complex protein 3